MAGAVQNCQNQPEDICTKLAREIDEMINRQRNTGSGTKGLKQRFQEQIEGANGPPNSGVGDPAVWDRHQRAIEEQQRGLRNRIKKFNDNNCGDKIPIPADAKEWADKPVPQPSEWKGVQVSPTNTEPATDSGFMKKMSELTGLSGTALLIYVIISEGSRVFPPRDLVPIP